MKYSDFDRIANMDDELIEELSDFICPFDASAESRVIAKVEKKMRSNYHGTDFSDEDSVSGVDRYTRPKWYMPLKAAAVCLILLGSISSGALIVSRFKDNNSQSTSNTQSNYTCTEIVNAAVEAAKDFPEHFSIDTSDTSWKKTFGQMYFFSGSDNVKDFCAIHSSIIGRDDEIAIIEFNSPENASEFISTLEERKNDRYESYKKSTDCSETSLEIIENTVIIQEGNYALYIACENNEDVLQVCFEMIRG